MKKNKKKYNKRKKGKKKGKNVDTRRSIEKGEKKER